VDMRASRQCGVQMARSAERPNYNDFSHVIPLSLSSLLSLSLSLSLSPFVCESMLFCVVGFRVFFVRVVFVRVYVLVFVVARVVAYVIACVVVCVVA